MAKQQKQAALGFIFITLLIDVTGFGIIIPVLPKLIEQLIHCNLGQASNYGGWLLVVYAIMQYVCSPILGNLSDRYGRRPILLFSLFGLGMDYLLQGFAPNIFWLFVGRFIAGITGGSFTTASAYIADISTPEKTAQNVGMIGAAFGLGFIIGPVLGGVLGHYGPRVPFFAAAVLAFLNWIYGFFILPESLPAHSRRKFEWKRANPMGSLLQLKKYPVSQKSKPLYNFLESSTVAIISGLVFSITLLYIAGHAVQSCWNYYTMSKFGWDERMVGYSLGFIGLIVGLVQGVLIRAIIPKLGQGKRVYMGLSLYAIGFLLFAFASTTWMMFVFMIPYALGGIAGPSIQGLISGHVPANEQVELQGALTSLMSGTSIVGPLMMTHIFAYFTSPKAPIHVPGAGMLLGALLTFISTLLAYRTLKEKKHS
jgi:DHA1 family tetracycline resistance protein-like MFS transporter